MLGIKLPARCRYYSHRLFELHPEVRAMRGHIARSVGRRSVLEIGCGFGENARRCQGEYLGLDPDAGVIAEARRRHPHRRFGLLPSVRRQGRPEPLEDAPSSHTVLLCLVLHETEQREALLARVADLDAPRVLIYDFDPALTGASRRRVTFWEESCIHSYWGFDPARPLGETGYRLHGEGPMGPRIRFWQFERG